MSEQRCELCRFVVMEDLSGECRRRSPIADPSTQYGHIWPRVFKDDRCGEYEQDVDKIAEALGGIVRGGCVGGQTHQWKYREDQSGWEDCGVCLNERRIEDPSWPTAPW